MSHQISIDHLVMNREKIDLIGLNGMMLEASIESK